MVLCPVAIAVHCSKCPIVGVCPLKGVLGDYKPEEKGPAAGPTTKARSGANKRR